MSFSVILDWKSFAALGLSAIGIILAMKMDSDQATEVSTSAVEACKEIGIHTIAE